MSCLTFLTKLKKFAHVLNFVPSSMREKLGRRLFPKLADANFRKYLCNLYLRNDPSVQALFRKGHALAFSEARSLKKEHDAQKTSSFGGVLMLTTEVYQIYLGRIQRGKLSWSQCPPGVFFGRELFKSGFLHGSLHMGW